MATDKKSDERVLVEHFRSTGYEGREPWIAALDPVLGTRVVAVRQFEACATHPACAWRDEVDNEIGLWDFMRDCLLAPIRSLAQIVEGTISQESGNGHQSENGLTPAVTAWRTICRFLERMQRADPCKTSYADTAVGFLIAVMVFRQIVDNDARRGPAATCVLFVPQSTNVHPTFLPQLFDKLAGKPFDLDSRTTLSELCERLEALSACQNPNSIARLD